MDTEQIKDCANCGNELDEEDLDYKETESSGSVICYSCWIQENMSTCMICEDHYENIEEVKDYWIVVTEELAKDQNIEMGIYKVIEFPFYYGCLVTGFDGLYIEAVELRKSIDINSVKKKRCGKDCEEVTSGQICLECASKYTLADFNSIRVNYTDPFTRLHFNIYERGLIQTRK